MIRWREWWERSRRGAGAAGACGVAAALAAAWLYGVGVQEGRDEVARLREAAQAAAARSSVRATPGSSPATARIEAFHDYFPTADTLQDWIERIDAAGAAAGVTVERTDYRIGGVPAAGLERYHIQLPVKATFPQVRTLVSVLLESVPTLALSSIDIKREGIGAGMVDARLEFVLFLKARPR